MAEDAISLHRALALTGAGNRWRGEICPGWDVFGIPHGGYVMAMAAHAALKASSEPDVFSVTVHFLKKGAYGSVVWDVREVSRSRRFRSFTVEGSQGDSVILSALALVGDRSGIEGEAWHRRSAPRVACDEEQPREAGAPAIAERLGVHMSTATMGFARGERGDAVIHALVAPPEPTPTDQLLAIAACDATAPAIWNALGVSGWVPTIELTAQVRARPVPGPLTVVASTRSVSGGFLEEDAEVYDTDGNLIVLSRQLARWRS